MILEVEEGEVRVEHYLVDYDVDKVAHRIVEVGLTGFLASGLYQGI